MLKRKIKLIALLFCLTLSVKAQLKHYQYQRELKGITSNWHSLPLPNAIFKNTQRNLNDLRIYGIKGKDTIEVPYILEQSADQIIESETSFNIINQSNNAQGYYYTFQSTTANTPINQIRLSFGQRNFDWKVTLEGSNNNNEWFTILKNYRILSILNNNTDYHFSQLNFPNANYGYFRILVKANEQPQLRAAKILKTDTLRGIDTAVAVQAYQLHNDIKNKQSVIEVSLVNPSPLSHLKLNVKSNLDFYRPIKIESVTDSFKTDKGIQYNYQTLYQGTISSLENTAFNFSNTLTSRLRITIDNNDNKPLQLNGIVLKGPISELIARFEKTDYEYALYYGDKNASAPSYELKNFESKIPIGITALTMGDEQQNTTSITKTENPLFENKAWLWGLMVLIIFLLGFFAFKMLKN
ncbi:DUF3999 family protein [Pedobacter sp. Hv1]|uniref:DUF3999 family protein n=1 Tax=Pedobacter sp. Hv1 TaxID=1740090 RepID=UPI0006D88F24|nr:DUF3999 family protein [Pedobacter sp. Hv1]KQC02310.1 hypothetical protein AQF98_01660 [Pedobacter sp. Hv1]